MSAAFLGGAAVALAAFGAIAAGCGPADAAVAAVAWTCALAAFPLAGRRMRGRRLLPPVAAATVRRARAAAVRPEWTEEDREWLGETGAVLPGDAGAPREAI